MQIASGSFNTVTRDQADRLNRIRELIRRERARYEGVMAPDPDRAEDADGNPYWGSRRHMAETMLRLLETALKVHDG
jgi:hypothetical protein